MKVKPGWKQVPYYYSQKNFRRLGMLPHKPSLTQRYIVDPRHNDVAAGWLIASSVTLIGYQSGEKRQFRAEEICRLRKCWGLNPDEEGWGIGRQGAWKGLEPYHL